LKYGMRIKKSLSTREKFKGDLYWKHYNVLFLSVLLCCFCSHITEYERMGGGGGRAKFSCAQGRKIPKYGPDCAVDETSTSTGLIHDFYDSQRFAIVRAKSRWKLCCSKGGACFESHSRDSCILS
jgi:hypothetical protein